MATPLSDKIRALITYSNEITENGDTKLGDCVRTLVQGYNGGSNVPSSPLAIPTGPLSSRLASLLAYANETTGVNDTLLGDAIRTLCEGFGNEEPSGGLVFYDRLVTYGKAYIATDYKLTDAITHIEGIWKPINGGSSTFFGARNFSTSSNHAGIWAGNLTRTVYCTFGGTGSTIASSDNTENFIVVDIEDGNGTIAIRNASKSFTVGTSHPTASMGLFAKLMSSGIQAYSTDGTYIKYLQIKEGDTTAIHLVPCTYNGEPGMWDLVEQKFYGNANSVGHFEVEDKIEFYDVLNCDGGYLDLGPMTTWNDKYSFAVKLIEYKGNVWLGAGSGGQRMNIYGSSTKTRKFYSVSYPLSAQKSAYLANTILDWNEGWIDLASGTSEFNGVSSSGLCNNTSYLTDAYLPTTNLRLFGNGGETNATYSYKGMVKYFKIERNGKLYMHLVPCTLNGEAGMFDKVHHKFYGNSNASGSFTVSNDEE